MPTVQELYSLEGQTALVTGGTRGIGQAMALALAEAGADILLVQVCPIPPFTTNLPTNPPNQRDTTNQATKTAIEALGRRATIYTADLSSQTSISALTPAILADGHRIHILLNCGGIQRRHPAHQFPDADWDAVLQVNLTSVFTLCRDVGAHMLSAPASLPLGRRGAIINVASLLTFQGGITVPAYAASKGGVGQLTKALSNEWAGQGVSVNAIAPGYVATDMNEALIKDEKRAESILGRIPAGRWGAAEDFKGVVVFLASAASAYVSGEVVTVDGGWMGR
jgi:2-deoxy-D-gluconate 3-dehydrogenase